MPETPSVNQPAGDIFLELADTVNQSVPAKRLVAYKLKNKPDGNPRYWAIVDFNQHSAQKRFYLFDTKQKQVSRYYVAHGIGSEGERDDGMADVFSNVPGSKCSSLGVYLCLDEYIGKHGKSLRLQGLEPTNSKAFDRAVVLHNAEYVSDAFIQETGRIGRSDGCFVVEKSVSGGLVDELKNGSFIIASKDSPADKLTNITTEESADQMRSDVTEQIKEIAAKSPCAKYNWKDRGRASIGYFKGVALTYAKSYRELKKGQNTPVKTMSRKLDDAQTDALAWYGITANSDVERLRSVYTLALGLGLRESSGNTTEGRDTTVQHPTEANAEAGLFQVSYDSFDVSPELKRLFEQYKADESQCLYSVFMEGTPDKKRAVVGTGKGAEFQKFTKECPAFATEYVMIMLRLNRKHFGPINTKKAEYNLDAERMFKDIEKIIDKIP